MWRTKTNPKKAVEKAQIQTHRTEKTLLTEINYARTELIENANEHNIYKKATKQRKLITRKLTPYKKLKKSNYAKTNTMHEQTQILSPIGVLVSI